MYYLADLVHIGLLVFVVVFSVGFGLVAGQLLVQLSQWGVAFWMPEYLAEFSFRPLGLGVLTAAICAVFHHGLAGEIASNAPLAVRAIKRMMRAAETETFEQNVHPAIAPYPIDSRMSFWLRNYS